MNYELAKELKDAGFLQPDKDNYYPGDYLGGHAENERAYAPTLEELIEACGENNFTLQHPNGADFWTAGTSDTWMGDKTAVGQGSTPTEAVARLWLALNKKV